MKVTTYQEAMDRVFVFEEIKDYSLIRMQEAVKLLGDPLKDIKVIHIAGTNGKGSVTKMVFSVLKSVGLKVGALTSPHLVSIRERFETHKGLISEEDFIDCVNAILALEIPFSYFEKTVLISFLLFKKKKVDYAVIEVGVGGLYDSTNIVNPTITAITTIGLDHTKMLGDTLEKISYQKAGIIKEGVPIVYNHINAIIAEVANEKKAPTIFTTKKVQTNLIGAHQERNAAIAFAICKYILGKDQHHLILDGLQKVQHFGRLQYIYKNILIDGAHNQQGLRELNRYLQTLQGSFLEITLCIAVKKGKTGDMILNEFYPQYKDYMLIQSQNAQIVEKTNILMLKLLKQAKDISLTQTSSNEVFQGAQKNPTTLYVVFGSLYMIGDFYNK